MRHRSIRILFTGAVSLVGLAAGNAVLAQAANQTPAINLSQAINGVSRVSGLGAYIALVYTYAVNLSAIAATVMLIYGGFRYLMGSTQENVSRGKEIIRDAIIGMILVLSAWLILHTVNPATLNLAVLNPTVINRIANPTLTALSDCSVRNVQQSQLTSGQPPPPGAEATQLLVAHCAKDSECGTGKCMRTSYYGNTAQPGTGPFIPADDLSGQLGFCSEGLEGHLCRCSGEGCYLTSSGWHIFDPSSANADVTRLPSSPDDFSAYVHQIDLRVSPGHDETTNNGGLGAYSCQNNLPCVFLDNQGQTGNRRSFGWYCSRVPSRSGGRPGNVIVQNCVSDAAGTNTPKCSNDGDRCMRTDSAPGANSGECSPADGAPIGSRCKCSKFGCLGAPYNRLGTVLATNTVHCAQGLVCALYNYHAGDPPDGDWFCSNPDASDAGTVDRSCLGLRPGTGTCSYQCTSHSSVVGTVTTAPPGAAPVSCSGATQAEADQVCQTACSSASEANSCPTKVSGSTCATSPAPTCAGWTSPTAPAAGTPSSTPATP